MKNIFMKFDSVSAFHSYIQNNKPTDSFSSEYSQHSQTGSLDFTGTFDFEEAEKFFTYGDKNIAKMLEEGGIKKTRLNMKVSGVRRKIYADMCGFAPHIPNYLAGVPTSMLNIKQVKVKEKVINVIYNISANGGVKAKDLLSAGVAMLSAIMKIEASGVRVNLYAADISETSSQKIGWICRIKNSGQHIDTLKMCYPLCSPSMLRRHSFRFTEITKGVSSSFVGNYGAASRDVSDMINAFKIKDCRALSYYSVNGLSSDLLVEKILRGECN